MYVLTETYNVLYSTYSCANTVDCNRDSVTRFSTHFCISKNSAWGPYERSKTVLRIIFVFAKIFAKTCVRVVNNYTEMVSV